MRTETDAFSVRDAFNRLWIVEPIPGRDDAWSAVRADFKNGTYAVWPAYVRGKRPVVLPKAGCTVFETCREEAA